MGVTAKLIGDMRGEDEAVSKQQLAEVTGDAAIAATAMEKCDDNNEQLDDDKANGKDTEALSRRESVDEVKKKSIIVNVEEVETKVKSVTAAQRDEIQKKKKSLME